MSVIIWDVSPSALSRRAKASQQFPSMSLLLLHPRVFDMVLDVDRFKSQRGGHITKKNPETLHISPKSKIKVSSSGSWFITPWGPISGPSELPSGSIYLWPHKAVWDNKSICPLFQYGNSFLPLQLFLRENSLVLPVNTTTLAHYSCLLCSDSHNAPSAAWVLSGSYLPPLYLRWIFQLSLKFVVHKIDERENQVLSDLPHPRCCTALWLSCPRKSSLFISRVTWEESPPEQECFVEGKLWWSQAQINRNN